MMGSDALVAAWNLERQAVHVWGAHAQRLAICEEAGELVAAISKHARNRITDAELLDEAADAIIVACGAANVAGYGPGALREKVFEKLARLEKRLEGSA